MTITNMQKIKLKQCYEKILDEAEFIDEILEGSIFKDEITDLVVKQADEFNIKLK